MAKKKTPKKPAPKRKIKVVGDDPAEKKHADEVDKAFADLISTMPHLAVTFGANAMAKKKTPKKPARKTETPSEPKGETTVATATNKKAGPKGKKGRQKGVNKSAKIRTALEKNPELSTEQLVNKFGVSANLATKLRSDAGLTNGRSSGRKKKVGRPKGSKRNGLVSTTAYLGNATGLHQTVEFIKASGGIDAALASIRLVEEIKGL